MNGFDFFDNIYYINLASRPDRNDALLEQARQQDIHPIRLEATTPAELGHDNNHLAFNTSQYKALCEVDGSKVLILEDDCVFGNTSFLGEALGQLPTDFDCIFLGANIHDNGCELYSENLVKYLSGWTTHAVGYSRKCIEFIIDNFKPDEFPIYDEWLRVNVLTQGNSYCVCPMVAGQSPGFSDIWQEKVDYGFYNQWGNKIRI